MKVFKSKIAANRPLLLSFLLPRKGNAYLDPKEAFLAAGSVDNGQARLLVLAQQVHTLAVEIESTVRSLPEGTNLTELVEVLYQSGKLIKNSDTVALRKQLPHAREVVNQWLKLINDPEFPDAGLTFFEKLEQTGCTHAYSDDPKFEPVAAYTSFSLSPEDRGFQNKFTYGRNAAVNPLRLYSSIVHEGTHCLQKKASAGLHASPFNPYTSIIVCPRDWILLEERCEQDAYAKQAWLNSLLAHMHPDVKGLTHHDSLSVETFDQTMRVDGVTLQQAIEEATRLALLKPFYVVGDQSIFFLHHYQQHALNGYKGAMGNTNNAAKSVIFVRAEPEDIYAIGQSSGPNGFGFDPHNPVLVKSSQLRPEVEEDLTALNTKLGIKDENQLPTLGEALKAQGLTRENFIARAYNSRPQQSTPAAPQP